MAETLTANYGWTKPDPGASANTWGATLNATTDKVDAQVYANAQAGVPVGSILMFAGNQAVPTNWLQAVGQSLDTTAYAALFAVIGYTYGGSGANFNLPNLVTRFPLGQSNWNSPGATGGEATHVLTAAELAAHAHPITDVAHNHTVNQTPHAHPDPGHGHPGSTAGDSGTHTHGSNLMRFVGSGGTLGVGISPNNVTPGNTDPNNAPGVTVNIAPAGAGLQAINANVSLVASGTNLSTTQNAGGGAAHNNMPPYLQINFIIKYQ